MKDEVYLTIPNSLKHEFLNSGVNGMCYKTIDGKVFKHCLNGNDCYDSMKYIAKYYKSDSFIFPECFIYLDAISKDSFIGYTMDYVDGTSIANLDNNVEINKFISSLEVFEKELLRLSKSGIIMTDINAYNILYTIDNQIKVVDTDQYIVSYGEEYIGVKENVMSFSNSLMVSFYYLKHEEGVKINEVYNQLIYDACVYARLRPSEFISKTVEEINKCNYDVNNIGEFKEGIKILKKWK